MNDVLYYNKSMNKLKQIIEKSDTPIGKAFDLIIQFLILVSIILFSIETLPEYSKGNEFLNLSEKIIVGIFTLEYLLRLFVADKKLGFIFSFWGLIDFLAIIPSYLSFGVLDLRFIRILRFLRLVRILKLARYSHALDRLKNAFKEIKEELIIFGFATLFVLYIAGAGIYFFENQAQPENFKSIFHSLWWAVATLTTVGYGDVYPVTVGGKVFTFIILMIGLGIVSIPAGLLASALSSHSKKN